MRRTCPSEFSSPRRYMRVGVDEGQAAAPGKLGHSQGSATASSLRRRPSAAIMGTFVACNTPPAARPGPASSPEPAATAGPLPTPRPSCPTDNATVGGVTEPVRQTVTLPGDRTGLPCHRHGTLRQRGLLTLLVDSTPSSCSEGPTLMHRLLPDHPIGNPGSKPTPHGGNDNSD